MNHSLIAQREVDQRLRPRLLDELQSLEIEEDEFRYLGSSPRSIIPQLGALE
jgi:hypothetical protein